MFAKEPCISAEMFIIKNNYSKYTLNIKPEMFISV